MKRPAEFEHEGQIYRFEEGNTLAHNYLFEPVYNHVEHFAPRHKVVLWSGKLAVWMSGMDIGGIIDDEDESYFTDFYQQFGWNAPILLKRHVPEEVKEGYIAKSNKYLDELPTYKEDD